MRQCVCRKQKKRILFILLAFSFIFSFAFAKNQVSAASTKKVKIKYNGKTYTNKSKKLTVKYNNKTITNSSYKALVIKGSYMVPYTDVFKKGLKATCTYKKKTKKLTIKKNGVTIKMTVGKKTAYVNGKKVKLPAAPLSVRYVSKKKTKILVPIGFIAKKLHFTYRKTSTRIVLEDTFHIAYDDVDTYYSGVRGSIYYNHVNYDLSTMPVLKIDGSMYCPAEEVLSQILKLKYNYNASTGTITIDHEELMIEVIAQIGSDVLSVNGTEVTMSTPVRIIRDVNKKKDVVCIPAAAVLKQLNYKRSWNKTQKYYQIQSQSFFSWNAELTEQEKNTTDTNYIYAFASDYSESDGTGSINFSITGSQKDIMSTATVVRDNVTITVTLPNSQYKLEKNSFENFGEIIKKVDVVTNSDQSVTISLTCVQTSEFSYVIQENTLLLNVFYNYSQKDGTSTDYSLTIPKPKGFSFDKVSNQDLYASKKFKVILQGDYVDFYQSNPVVISNNAITGVSVEKVNNTTEITVNTSTLCGYKIYDDSQNISVLVGAPKDIYKSIIVLDAGHGGSDPGAQHNGTNEKDITYKIIYTLMQKHTSSNAPDIKVYWTRTTDTFISLAKRAAFAKSVGADAFISLHMNSASNSSANGTEVYYSVSNNSSSFSGITSKKMATMFKNKLVNTLGTKSRGTKTAGYYVIKHNTVPAILIELGFLSGNKDYSNLVNSAFQEKAANAIYEQIVAMFQSYPTGR